ncbi:MAG: hypothetical protein M0C28_29550 [Candidatus Moduliflexus flocculans]|nr:hypothetical protein [Candidatus Moduliflexus flocculans]
MAIPLFHVYGMVAGMNFCDGRRRHAWSWCQIRATSRMCWKTSTSTNRPSSPACRPLYNAINNHPEVKAGKSDLRSIKACISGSAPLMRETKETFESFDRRQGVRGLRPLGGADRHSLQSAASARTRPAPIGMPLPDVDAKIISLDDGETELAHGRDRRD